MNEGNQGKENAVMRVARSVNLVTFLTLAFLLVALCYNGQTQNLPIFRLLVFPYSICSAFSAKHAYMPMDLLLFVLWAALVVLRDDGT